MISCERSLRPQEGNNPGFIGEVSLLWKEDSQRPQGTIDSGFIAKFRYAKTRQPAARRAAAIQDSMAKFRHIKGVV